MKATLNIIVTLMAMAGCQLDEHSTDQPQVLMGMFEVVNAQDLEDPSDDLWLFTDEHAEGTLVDGHIISVKDSRPFIYDHGAVDGYNYLYVVDKEYLVYYMGDGIVHLYALSDGGANCLILQVVE